MHAFVGKAYGIRVHLMSDFIFLHNIVILKLTNCILNTLHPGMTSRGAWFGDDFVVWLINRGVSKFHAGVEGTIHWTDHILVLIFSYVRMTAHMHTQSQTWLIRQYSHAAGCGIWGEACSKFWQSGVLCVGLIKIYIMKLCLDQLETWCRH